MFQRRHYEFIDAKTLKTSYSARKTINMNVIASNSESSYQLRTKDNVTHTNAVINRKKNADERESCDNLL